MGNIHCDFAVSITIEWLPYFALTISLTGAAGRSFIVFWLFVIENDWNKTYADCRRFPDRATIRRG